MTGKGLSGRAIFQAAKGVLFEQIAIIAGTIHGVKKDGYVRAIFVPYKNLNNESIQKLENEFKDSSLEKGKEITT